MNKLVVLAAGGVGYVLGARAGRERYEQIKGMAVKVKQDPRVQQTATHAADLAKEKGPVVAEKVTSAATATAAAAVDKVSPSHSAGTDDSTDRTDLEEQLHPDSVARQDNPYPQGDLP